MNRNTISKELQRRKLGDTKFHYYLSVPPDISGQTRIFITVHGWSRNVLEHAEGYLPFAKKYGVILIAPYFGRKHFPQFQQLGSTTDKGRADLVLDMIIAEVIDLVGIKKQPVYLFGYSGGGQFAHRYTMAHPENVARAALGAPGWFTFPDSAREYPLGIGSNGKLQDIEFRPADFLRVPTKVLVGELDNFRNHHFNGSRKIDKLQGTNRQQRAQHWVKAMKAAAEARGYRTQYSLNYLPNSDHSFTNCMKIGNMGEQVFEFLFGKNFVVPNRKNTTVVKSN
jgi:pimeloyl-ACP methyl ester carboxylesterase